MENDNDKETRTAAEKWHLHQAQELIDRFEEGAAMSGAIDIEDRLRNPRLDENLRRIERAAAAASERYGGMTACIPVSVIAATDAIASYLETFMRDTEESEEEREANWHRYQSAIEYLAWIGARVYRMEAQS